MRYVANAGMLVSIEGASFLIDAPTRDGITPYETSPADERTRLEEAKPPYDDVDAILVTHWHEDHFSPEAVAAHLGRNPRAVFISSPEVVTRLRAARPDLAANRIRAVLPPPGQSEEVTVGGVTVRVLRIRHNPTRRLPEQHVGFLIGTRATVLHVGDGDPAPDNFTLLRTLPQVDTALLPFWYVLDEANRRFVATSIAPRRIVGMHLATCRRRRGCPQAAGRWRRGRSAAGARVAGASRALNGAASLLRRSRAGQTRGSSGAHTPRVPPSQGRDTFQRPSGERSGYGTPADARSSVPRAAARNEAVLSLITSGPTPLAVHRRSRISNCAAARTICTRPSTTSAVDCRCSVKREPSTTTLLQPFARRLRRS